MKTTSTLPDSIGGAILAELAGVTVRRIQQLAQAGALPTPSRGEYPCTKSLAALFAHFRTGSVEEMAAVKLRKATADAATAELRAAKLLGDVIIATDVEDIWRDAATRVRETIERTKYLDDGQKDRLLKDLETIELDGES